MSNEEAQKILDSMHSVNPENLRGEAKKLFEAVMKIADERDSLRKIVERQNLEIMAQKDAHTFDAGIIDNVNEELKEKNETINKQKELIEYLRRSCDRKESCWIEEQHENVELETKLEEKDNTINAMAEYIASRDIDEDICKYINCGEGDKEREECVECVIDFFEEF
jgi:hypothetical protein